MNNKIHSYLMDDILILITYRSVKHLYIKVDVKGDARCIVPLRLSSSQICDILEKKRSWIKEHVAKREAHNRNLLCFESGERHFFLGKSYELVLLKTVHQRKVYCDESCIYLYCKESDDAVIRQSTLEKWYRREFSLMLPSLIEECEVITKQVASEWRIKAMKSRWGSCNIQKRRIWLNLYLIKKPVDVIKYVMIHELTHFYERSHNQIFKKYMKKFSPNSLLLDEILNNQN